MGMSLRNFFTSFACALFALVATGKDKNALSTTAALYNETYTDAASKGKWFALTAQVLSPRFDMAGGTISVADDTGAMILHTAKAAPHIVLAAGDVISATGVIATDARGCGYARCESISVIRHDTPQPPAEIANGQLDSGRYDCRLVTIRGIVIDAFIDEIDPNFIFYILNCNGYRLTVATESAGLLPDSCAQFIGRTLSAIGVCRPSEGGARTKLGRYIRTTPSNVHFSDTATHDPFSVPEIRHQRILEKERDLSKERKLLRGLVLAVWQNDKALVRTERGDVAYLSFAFSPLPKCGETIDAVGFPETDPYQINLVRCLWRPSPQGATIRDDRPPDDVTIKALLTDTSGRRRFNSRYHGRRVRLSGYVRNIPLTDDSSDRILLENDLCTIPVDVSTCSECIGMLEIGSFIKIDGVCIMEAESWSPSSPFPHVKELFVSLTDSSHVTVIKRPPWWTLGRMLAVMGCLFLVTCGSLFWNFTLRRVVSRKSRELKAEITARLASDLKSRERTRLAVELHDSIAQNLSGASMEIGSAIQFLSEDPTKTLPHLKIASRTLHACRDDLRNCMWDLRSKALEDTDMNGAIRTTLMPYVSDVSLQVRFNVPRQRFSDNTAHAILRIVRELTLNAVHHGQASAIRIAGSAEQNRLLFSVQDNGIGFDPENHPGVSQGHFGLQGVRERINSFGGTMEIASSPAHGTKVTLSLDLAQQEEEEAIAI